jgi:hypothetical protein
MTFNLPNLTHWKIEIVNKGNTQEAGLCDFLIDSFTELTAGLLSNAALSAIASIRDNTHNLLHKFNKELDTAYLSHVLGLISSPDMREQANEVAFDYAVDLISEELKSELQISQIVKESLSEEILKSWPQHMSKKQKANRFRIKVGGHSIDFNNRIMEKLLAATQEQNLKTVLNEDLEITDQGETTALDIFSKNVIQLTFDGSDITPLLELCSLESTRRDVVTLKQHIPVLKQGTIVKSFEDNNYYLCIQPICDTVRICGKSTFSFLKIKKDNSDFTHVIRLKDGHLKLKIDPSAKFIKTFELSANAETKTIVSTEIHGGKFIFSTNDTMDGDNVLLEWCGELKHTVSQAIVNGLAAQLARVGLDSFEWLRQKQK